VFWIRHQGLSTLRTAVGNMKVATVSVAVAALCTPVWAGCEDGNWAVAYSPEHCHMEGNAAIVSCNAKSGDQCGTRFSSNFHVGQGSHAMEIKAAPGSGVATTFYLSNNGGLYDKTKTHPWVELDFEIMGHMAGPQSKIWTNMFTGIAVEHNQWITVPFDVTAGYHTFAFEITDASISWIVDGETYRKEDITRFSDVQQSVRTSAFQEFASVWGKSSSEPGEGIAAFREALGLLDTNSNSFPIHAGFRRALAAGNFEKSLASVALTELSSANVMTLYHSTSLAAAESIVAGNFKAGRMGWCGGAVYFMDYPGLPAWKKNPKSTQVGAVVKATVDMGKMCEIVKADGCDDGDSGKCCPAPHSGRGHGVEAAQAAGCNSIKWTQPGDLPEYIIWEPERVLSKSILCSSPGECKQRCLESNHVSWHCARRLRGVSTAGPAAELHQ